MVGPTNNYGHIPDCNLSALLYARLQSLRVSVVYHQLSTGMYQYWLVEVLTVLMKWIVYTVEPLI